MPLVCLARCKQPRVLDGGPEHSGCRLARCSVMCPSLRPRLHHLCRPFADPTLSHYNRLWCDQVPNISTRSRSPQHNQHTYSSRPAYPIITRSPLHKPTWDPSTSSLRPGAASLPQLQPRLNCNGTAWSDHNTAHATATRTPNGIRPSETHCWLIDLVCGALDSPRLAAYP